MVATPNKYVGSALLGVVSFLWLARDADADPRRRATQLEDACARWRDEDPAVQPTTWQRKLLEQQAHCSLDDDRAPHLGDSCWLRIKRLCDDVAFNQTMSSVLDLAELFKKDTGHRGGRGAPKERTEPFDFRLDTQPVWRRPPSARPKARLRPVLGAARGLELEAGDGTPIDCGCRK